MAFGKKCYCCEEVYPKDVLFYCEECLMKLSKAFKTGEGVVLNPKHYDHCISCGEYENRKIVYTGNTRLFPTHPKDSVPICDKCVQEELKNTEKSECKFSF